MTLRHDLHHLTCNCGIAEFTTKLDCAEVREYIARTFIGDKFPGGRCPDCGGPVTIRPLQLVSTSPDNCLTPEIIYYEAGHPMPVLTWLAAFNARSN